MQQIKIVPQIKFKSVLSKYPNTNEGIKERNEHFDSLSDEGKRLEIAWDGLQLVLNNQVFASHGSYWNLALTSIQLNSRSSSEFQKKLIGLEEDKYFCRVCQRGLMMLSQIRLGNKLDQNDREIDCGHPSNLRGFSILSMERMEWEYEDSYYAHPFSHNTEAKLANICCNVLINGDFNTRDKNEYIKIEQYS